MPASSPAPTPRWALIFTSGTSAAPKAVICSQRRILVTGTAWASCSALSPDDIGYVCMPLFHSNAVMVGWAPSIVYGASVGLARRFSASGWLPDVRRYRRHVLELHGQAAGVPLATPEQPDDADNPLRIAYGNEGSPSVVAEFARRFDLRGDRCVRRDRGRRRREPRRRRAHRRRSGWSASTVQVVDDDGTALPAAEFDAAGRLLNAADCVGEIVNTAGAGPFEGYYNNDEANAKALRNGWYWSGDLGYIDDDGFLYFAGRTADWIRVDGENFPAGPIQTPCSPPPRCARRPSPTACQTSMPATR